MSRKNSLPIIHTGLQVWTSFNTWVTTKTFNYDYQYNLQPTSLLTAWPGFTVNFTWRLAIVDGKPGNFILLYILLLWSYNKIICLLLRSCWGNWLRWLWYHGVTIGCAIMHSIHRWTDWLQNKKKKRFIEHTNTADIRCTSNVWGQINLDAWWGFDSTSHRLKHNLAKCNNTNNTNIRTRSDFEKHLTIKNCDKTFLKII